MTVVGIAQNIDGKPVAFIVAHKQQQKQIFENKYNKVKNPKQLKANQLDIYKQDQGVEQIELAVRVGIELRAARLQ